MNQNILLSKITGTPTDTSWAQAYSTLNLYIVIGIRSEKEDGQESIASVGKNLLERLQREFFALDKKNLTNIKEATTRAVENAQNPSVSYSILQGIIIHNILYIVIAHAGTVLLKRGSKTGIIAQGEMGEIMSFSGKLQQTDTVVFATESFLSRIPFNELVDSLSEKEFSDISENIAPQMHENSTGDEAAILLQYNPEQKVTPPQEHAREQGLQEENPHVPHDSKKSFFLPSFPVLHFKQFSLPHLKLSLRKILIPAGIIILLALFIGSLFIEHARQKQGEQEILLKQALAPSQKKIEEADALASMNKNFALDTLVQAKNELLGVRGQFPENSKERVTINSMIKDIDKKIQRLGGGSAEQEGSVFFTARSGKSISALTAKGTDLAVINTESTVTLVNKETGKEADTISLDAKNSRGITGDKKYLYILSDDGVYKVEKGTKKSQKIVPLKNSRDISGIDTFLGNVYLLDSRAKDIIKYSADSFDKLSYLKDSKIEAVPVSFTIDSSIYVFEEGGIIQKFTRGRADNFSLRGLTKKIGKKGVIYTDEDLSSIFVLDPENKRIVALDKTGHMQKEYLRTFLQSASSFAVDSSGKKAFVLAGNKVFALEL